LNQKQRTEGCDSFRAASSGVLFTSDVSSRGLDYPGVTDVIQVGVPRTKAEYIHRIGRTGRAGDDGRGHLLVHEFERGWLDELADLPLTEVVLDSDSVSMFQIPDFLAMDIPYNVKAQAYYSRINHVMRNVADSSALDIMREAKRFAVSIGALDEGGRPPEITEANAEKMGLSGISDPAVHIVAAPSAPKKPKAPPLHYQMVPTQDMHSAAQSLLQLVQNRASGDTKIVVFCITPPVAAHYAELMRSTGRLQVFEVHPGKRKLQKQQSKGFEASSSGILFSAHTSVTSLPAKGVTEIVQLGSPKSDKMYDQWRQLAAESGGIPNISVILFAFESKYLQECGSEDQVSVDFGVQSTALNAGADPKEMPVDQKLLKQVYTSFLEHYATHPLLDDVPKKDIASEAKAFAESIGAVGEDGLLPPVAERVVNQLGFADIGDASILNVAADR